MFVVGGDCVNNPPVGFNGFIWFAVVVEGISPPAKAVVGAKPDPAPATALFLYAEL